MAMVGDWIHDEPGLVTTDLGSPWGEPRAIRRWKRLRWFSSFQDGLHYE